MISFRSYVTSGGKHPSLWKEFGELPEDILDLYSKNARETDSKIALILRRIGKDPSKEVYTSGWRSKALHLAIYAARGVPKDEIPMGSRHLTCQAGDVWDPDRSIGTAIQLQPELLQECGLWMESLNATHTAGDPHRCWVHLQTKPPKSGALIFIP